MEVTLQALPRPPATSSSLLRTTVRKSGSKLPLYLHHLFTEKERVTINSGSNVGNVHSL